MGLFFVNAWMDLVWRIRGFVPGCIKPQGLRAGRRLSPLRGFILFGTSPTACAVGCNLSPLRGFVTYELELECRFHGLGPERRCERLLVR